jgi:hypothetical protein
VSAGDDRIVDRRDGYGDRPLRVEHELVGIDHLSRS